MNNNPTMLKRLISAMPKAELHMHIEGSLEPAMIFELAQRNKITLPYPDVEALKQAYEFTDLQSFLDVYYAGTGVLIESEDFYDMAMAYFERAEQDNVVHAEIFFDPQSHLSRGVAFETMMQGFTQAKQDAYQRWGITSDYIMCFLRHLSEQEAFETLELALPWRDHFIGVGLDSSERGHPPEKFVQVFAACREAGLRVVAHAGEEGPAQYVRDAIDLLKSERIDHGVRSIDDADLVAHLVHTQIPLTVCPLSNVKLGVYAHMSEHVLPELLSKGVKVLINSDDPAYFGGYMNQNFHSLFEAHPTLTPQHAYQLARNSFEASFAEPELIAAWVKRLDAVWVEHQAG